jgi:succinate dehydrogenase/fumarate reductase flavoprotein subunit
VSGVDFDDAVDVVIVGSGAAGLVAALVVAERGMRPLVVEKSGAVGGSSSLSGGGLWIPDNPLMRAAGVADSVDDALTYLQDIIGDVGPASSPQRRAAFLRGGPEMVEFLQRLGCRFVRAAGYPDYHPDRPGGSVAGRCIEAKVFDLRTLGSWSDKVRGTPRRAFPVYSGELAGVALSSRTAKGRRTAARVAGRLLWRRLFRQRPVTMGQSLVGQLLHLSLRRSARIWLHAALIDLVVEDGRVVGAVIDRDGQQVRVGAAHGVVLAAGGFAHNDEMRQRHQPHPTSTVWTSASPTDTGDAIRIGIAAGAATALLDDAWWIPTALTPDNRRSPLLRERSLPCSIIVDSSGRRFMNESASYVDVGHWLYERHQQVPAVPSWIIIDSKHRGRYPFFMLRPGKTPPAAVGPGFLDAADTLEDLAAKTGVDPAGLAATVQRFNAFAAAGRDEDFHRGENAYDRYYGDPRNKPHPNLGPLDTPPYYASAVYPGDLGTKGGLLTDEHARVVRADGTPIPGLYAAGNTTASVMGRRYAGPGATLGPALTFAYLGARHATADTTHPHDTGHPGIHGRR